MDPKGIHVAAGGGVGWIRKGFTLQLEVELTGSKVELYGVEAGMCLDQSGFTLLLEVELAGSEVDLW